MLRTLLRMKEPLYIALQEQAPLLSGARSVSGTLASARHEPTGCAQCVVAIAECHHVAEADGVA